MIEMDHCIIFTEPHSGNVNNYIVNPYRFEIVITKNVTRRTFKVNITVV